jgi:pyruvate,water dikinase
MRWLPWESSKSRHAEDGVLLSVQRRFTSFLSLLDANNRVLKALGDLEQKAHGDELYDLSYIRGTVAGIRKEVRQIIEVMIGLGGADYEPLRTRFAEIDAEVEAALTGTRPVAPGAFTIRFGELGREEVASVGSKNAQLGELRSRLGLRVPDGFAISAWAYKHFIAANALQPRIDRALAEVDIRRYPDLVRASESIQEMFLRAEVPDDLAQAIRKSVAEVVERSGTTHFAMRSSALSEDDLLTFAGQYRSRLNVRADEAIERYREILAGKFTPKAIFYLLSHAFRESDLAMCVGCISMVDAVSAGAVYTRDPVHPEDGCLVINSVFGLGQLLMDGTLTPDVFRVRRTNCELQKTALVRKPERLVMRLDVGTSREPVPPDEQRLASIDATHVYELSRMALEVERHYGVPQEIEWAMDREEQIYLLQTRPLQLLAPPESAPEPPTEGLEILLEGGTTVCPGAGCGSVHRVASSHDLPGVPDRCVLAAPRPFPGLVSVLPKISALLIEVGGLASHTATLAREYRVPSILGLRRLEELRTGAPVTVDATDRKVYSGEHPDLVRSRWITRVPSEGDPLQRVLQRTLACLSPLNLLYPSDADFTIEHCQTVHDLTRFCHQKSVQELFEKATGLQEQREAGVRLRSEIPLKMNIVCLERDAASLRGKRWITEDQLRSLPMRAFWTGMKREGWPAAARRVGGRALVAESGPESRRSARRGFSEDSYAVLAREYMVVSLRMGYHFTTVEALSSTEPSKNFIYMQYKLGGASLDRRMRRLRLITEILTRLGFRNLSEGDSLDSRVTYLPQDAVLERLVLLGRLMIMTKQLDMALGSDQITDWYTKDFMRKLGLPQEAPPDPQE